MKITEAIKKVVDHQDLTSSEAEAVLEQIMAGTCADAQIASLLTALRMKGETIDELTGFARVMRRKALPVRPRSAVIAGIGGTEREALIDTCGTGGDVSGSFNISTATAFVVAGCGVRVAKHGNRSVSSRCGSADVVEALGVKIELSPERIARCVDEVGIGFLHAPLLHEAMKYVALARKQMGIRTIFNMLGPLTNPAGANAQVVGVYAAHLTEVLARVLGALGTARALVVHGSDGLDEITITGESKVSELRGGKVRTYTLAPEEFGLRRASLEEIQGGDAGQNGRIILEVLGGAPGPRRDVVLLNAAAALVASGRANDFAGGVRLAAESVDGGKALSKLNHLIEFTNL
ncbi:MAG TPA: anthranilate phosphoribosyltransferase [Blastocatellia bacterium]|jgi:anthranilate phosphoribosyltransferase|nr:anthranilate phosphoribosyltransferase [Blastocatellia bacterium]